MTNIRLFKMYPGPEVLVRNTMKYCKDKVAFTQSLPETKYIMKQFEMHRRYLITLS
jgi:hypothetical protein